MVDVEVGGIGFDEGISHDKKLLGGVHSLESELALNLFSFSNNDEILLGG